MILKNAQLHHRLRFYGSSGLPGEPTEAERRLVDEDFFYAEKVVLVLDNLNTHSPASLYEAFAPEEAKRIWNRLESGVFVLPNRPVLEPERREFIFVPARPPLSGGDLQ